MRRVAGTSSSRPPTFGVLGALVALGIRYKNGENTRPLVDIGLVERVRVRVRGSVRARSLSGTGTCTCAPSSRAQRVQR